jgi:hypothetical protein
MDLILGRGRLEIEQRLDVAAHDWLLAGVLPGSLRNPQTQDERGT